MKRRIKNYHSGMYWLNAFVTCIYRKPTFTGLYLSWDAFAPKSRKVNLIKCLTFRFVRITRLKANLNKLKIFFWVMGILRKSLLIPLTKLLISLGIISGHLALLNTQFMLGFFGLDLLASWLLIKFLPLLPEVIMRLRFEPCLRLELHFALFIRMYSLSSDKAI